MLIYVHLIIIFHLIPSCFNDGKYGSPISAPHLKLMNIHKNLVLKNDKECESFIFYFLHKKLYTYVPFVCDLYDFFSRIDQRLQFVMMPFSLHLASIMQLENEI
jgi:hypothetical protein